MVGQAKALYTRKTESGLQVSDASALEEAIAAIREDSSGLSWCTVCYATKSKVKLQSSGGDGLAGLAKLLSEKEDKVYYAIKGCLDSSGKNRFIAITWTGSKCPAMKKGRVSMHGGAMETVLPGAVARIHVDGADGETTELLSEKHLLSKAAEATKGVEIKSIP